MFLWYSVISEVIFIISDISELSRGFKEIFQIFLSVPPSLSGCTFSVELLHTAPAYMLPVLPWLRLLPVLPWLSGCGCLVNSCGRDLLRPLISPPRLRLGDLGNLPPGGGKEGRG